MWSDVILSAERQHFLQVFLWSALSVLAGTAALTLLAVRRLRSPLVTHFAIQMAAWGLVIAAITFARWQGLALRDVAGAARLERITWLNIGLDIGWVGVGATLAIVGRVVGKRMSLLGAGIGIAVHGLALFLLDVQFAALVSR